MAEVTNGRIYELVDRLRIEQKGDIIRLEVKVESLEREVYRQKIAIATAATKLGILGFIAASIIGGAISLLPGLLK